MGCRYEVLQPAHGLHFFRFPTKEEADYGPDSAFYRLSQACFEKRAGGFDYRVCPFSEAKQDHTLLGTWGKWVKDEGDNASAGNAAGYKKGRRVLGAPPPGVVPGKMLFENGEKCWNGPRRTMEVTFKCGAEDVVLGVSEPETCRYVAEMTTPAACGPVDPKPPTEKGKSNIPLV